MTRLLFFVFSMLLFARGDCEELFLKNSLATAPKESYVVTEQNKIYTFLYVFDKTDTKLILDEISLPVSCKSMPWRAWFETGAPGHTSWVRSTIDLNSGTFIEVFSLSRGCLLDPSEANPFLSTLLHLPFTPVPPEMRKRIGSSFAGHDTRPFWNPRVVVDGNALPAVSFAVWRARWPKDRSEISNKVIELYLPETVSNTFPSFFPYWFEIEGNFGSAKMRVVDSGFGAKPSTN